VTKNQPFLTVEPISRWIDQRTAGRLARIIHECRREAAETEASIAPAHPRRAGTRPFRGLLARRTAR
jgi:hypothetical protein